MRVKKAIALLLAGLLIFGSVPFGVSEDEAAPAAETTTGVVYITLVSGGDGSTLPAEMEAVMPVLMKAAAEGKSVVCPKLDEKGWEKKSDIATKKFANPLEARDILLKSVVAGNDDPEKNRARTYEKFLDAIKDGASPLEIWIIDRGPRMTVKYSNKEDVIIQGASGTDGEMKRKAFKALRKTLPEDTQVKIHLVYLTEADRSEVVEDASQWKDGTICWWDQILATSQSKAAELQDVANISVEVLEPTTPEARRALACDLLGANAYETLPEIGEEGITVSADGVDTWYFAGAKAPVLTRLDGETNDPVAMEAEAPAAEETAVTEDAPAEETVTETEEVPAEEAEVTEDAPAEETAAETEDTPAEDAATTEETPAEETAAETEEVPAEDAAVTEEALTIPALTDGVRMYTDAFGNHLIYFPAARTGQWLLRPAGTAGEWGKATALDTANASLEVTYTYANDPQAAAASWSPSIPLPLKNDDMTLDVVLKGIKGLTAENAALDVTCSASDKIEIGTPTSTEDGAGIRWEVKLSELGNCGLMTLSLAVSQKCPENITLPEPMRFARDYTANVTNRDPVIVEEDESHARTLYVFDALGWPGDGELIFQAKDYFLDPDGDRLHYELVKDEAAEAGTDEVFTVTCGKYGLVKVVLNEGKTGSQTFRVRATDSAASTEPLEFTVKSMDGRAVLDSWKLTSNELSEGAKSGSSAEDITVSYSLASSMTDLCGGDAAKQYALLVKQYKCAGLAETLKIVPASSREDVEMTPDETGTAWPLKVPANSTMGDLEITFDASLAFPAEGRTEMSSLIDGLKITIRNETPQVTDQAGELPVNLGTQVISGSLELESLKSFVPAGWFTDTETNDVLTYVITVENAEAELCPADGEDQTPVAPTGEATEGTYAVSWTLTQAEAEKTWQLKAKDGKVGLLSFVPVTIRVTARDLAERDEAELPAVETKLTLVSLITVIVLVVILLIIIIAIVLVILRIRKPSFRGKRAVLTAEEPMNAEINLDAYEKDDITLAQLLIAGQCAPPPEEAWPYLTQSTLTCGKGQVKLNVREELGCSQNGVATHKSKVDFGYTIEITYQNKILLCFVIDKQGAPESF